MAGKVTELPSPSHITPAAIPVHGWATRPLPGSPDREGEVVPDLQAAAVPRPWGSVGRPVAQPARSKRARDSPPGSPVDTTTSEANPASVGVGEGEDEDAENLEPAPPSPSPLLGVVAGDGKAGGSGLPVLRKSKRIAAGDPA